MSPERRWARVALCALVAAILYLPGLGRPALWEPDEGRYAEIAREMVVAADYVTPRDDWEPYFEKPPLVYWANAAAIRLFGANEFAARIPSALFTVGEVAATAAIADAMFGAAAGLLAALALALSPLVFGFARFASLDPALAFFLTAALGSFYAAARAPDFGGGAGRRWFLLAAAMLALGTLAKGPVALALGGGVALVWLLGEGRGRDIARIPFLSCAVVYAAIVVPWFALAEHRNPGFLGFFFIHEHLQRFLESREHGWGPYFFIPVVIGGTWPWILFVPLGVREMMRPSANDDAENRAARVSALRFLVTWFTVIFIFFSIPRSKLGSYALPMLPPLAIAAGYALLRLDAIGAARVRRMVAACAAANAVVAIAAIAIVWAFNEKANLNFAVAADATVIAAAFMLGALAALILARGGARPAAAVGALAATMLVVLMLGERLRADAAPTYRRLAAAVQPYLRPGCVLASYRHYIQSLPFYTQVRETRVEYRGEIGEFVPQSAIREPSSAFMIGKESRLREVWGSGACMVLIVNQRDLPPLMSTLTPAPVAIGCEGKKVAVYNGAAAPGAHPPDCGNPSARALWPRERATWHRGHAPVPSGRHL
ncbi:MAG TPA: phospholipid carrier-dependent glycosyltransferase [Candidatus Binataceae bacterium]